MPSEQELNLARQQNQGSELIEILGDRQEGAFGETMDAKTLATKDVVNAGDTKKLDYKKYTDRATRFL